jgi:hypothetical protein|tara:strand:+ start:765 stop:956 length:192 start_codon:yes stop_codon:yes gene_type:complete
MLVMIGDYLSKTILANIAKVDGKQEAKDYEFVRVVIMQLAKRRFDPLNKGGAEKATFLKPRKP